MLSTTVIEQGLDTNRHNGSPQWRPDTSVSFGGTKCKRWKLVYSYIAHREVPIPLTQSLWSWILSAGKCALWIPAWWDLERKQTYETSSSFNKPSCLTCGLDLMGRKQLLGFHVNAIWLPDEVGLVLTLLLA